MLEQLKLQTIPVNMYSANGRLMVSTPMPGLEAENITIEVTDQGQLRLLGELRGQLKAHDGKARHSRFSAPFQSSYWEKDSRGLPWCQIAVSILNSTRVDVNTLDGCEQPANEQEE